MASVTGIQVVNSGPRSSRSVSAQSRWSWSSRCSIATRGPASTSIPRVTGELCSTTCRGKLACGGAPCQGGHRGRFPPDPRQGHKGCRLKTTPHALRPIAPPLHAESPIWYARWFVPTGAATLLFPCRVLHLSAWYERLSCSTRVYYKCRPARSCAHELTALEVSGGEPAPAPAVLQSIEIVARRENLWVSHPRVASWTPVTTSSQGGGFQAPSPLKQGRPGWGLGLEMRRSTPILTFPLPGGRHQTCSSPRLPFRRQTHARKRSREGQRRSSVCQSVAVHLLPSTTHSFSRGLEIVLTIAVTPVVQGPGR